MKARASIVKVAVGLAIGVGSLLPVAAGASSLKPQVITFPIPFMFYTSVGPNSIWRADATGGASGNPVVYNIDSSSTSGCTYSPATGFVTFLAPAGTCIIDANQAGNATYAAAPQAQMTFKFSLPSQSVLIKTNVPTLRVGMTYQFTATSSGSNNPVVFSRSSLSTSGCVVSPDGMTVFKAPAGWCNVVATKAGNSTYKSVQSSWGFMVHPALTGTATTTTTTTGTSTTTTSPGGTGQGNTAYLTLFFTNGMNITPSMKKQLNAFATTMKSRGLSTLTLNGYYSRTKSALNADKLSAEIATNVSRYLHQRLSNIKFGKKMITIISGYGATMFRMGPPGSPKNRRVELFAST